MFSSPELRRAYREMHERTLVLDRGHSRFVLIEGVAGYVAWEMEQRCYDPTIDRRVAEQPSESTGLADWKKIPTLPSHVSIYKSTRQTSWDTVCTCRTMDDRRSSESTSRRRQSTFTGRLLLCRSPIASSCCTSLTRTDHHRPMFRALVWLGHMSALVRARACRIRTEAASAS